MSERITTVVRKLLRLAKSATTRHEAELARARAAELMERHNVYVAADDTDDCRICVYGVTGCFWREQLLVAIASAYKCRVLRETNPPHEALLDGLPSQIDSARHLYVAMANEISRAAIAEWESFCRDRSSLIDDDAFESALEILGPLLDSNTFLKQRPTKTQVIQCSAPLWFRSFHAVVAEELTKRANGAGKPRTDATNTRYVDPTAAEVARLKRDIDDLSDRIGRAKTEHVVERARSVAVTRARAIKMPWRSKRLLMSASSIPPPPPPPPPKPPSRWSLLEID